MALDEGGHRISVDLHVGDTIPTGTFVLLTRGEYSSYEVIGLFRAERDVIVPGKPSQWGYVRGELIPDIAMLSTLLEEVPFMETWGE